ncbi:hypothetical protein [Taibaiella soli]|uniref:Knr4/Smi1-like domain-containing protein n=1 Tax=Taibaiella soli TaxID=1649169 RepID=A0A2W2BDG1_9BACT|nr:hypothetical protein [Taibaiella soli]PZF74289.1 hypothetical protein DN068_04580 [Taibaiella soli]
MKLIPDDYIQFLHWLKNQTEAFWSLDPNNPANEYKCPEWAYGAKWTGMTEEQIDKVERKYNLTFTPEHRAFLKILHTPDKKERIGDYNPKTRSQFQERPLFRNWHDEDEVIKMLDWDYNTIAQDVKNNFWLDTWGERPEEVRERLRLFDQLYQSAPKLIPVTSHRFQLASTFEGKTPVLSVWGSEIVYYGSNFRYYLLNELSEHLNIYHKEFDEKAKQYYWVRDEAYNDYFESYDDDYVIPDIPFWKDFLS